jgi:Flp pilus assembly CpaE family ATPase
MPDTRLALSVRVAARRLDRLRSRGVHERLRLLEEEVQENRRLNRRVAELTDLVTELVVPLSRIDDIETQAVLERYRSII